MKYLRVVVPGMYGVGATRECTVIHTDRGAEDAFRNIRARFSIPAGYGFVRIFACNAARRSANHGWRVLHSCGSSSRSTAAECVSMSAMA